MTQSTEVNRGMLVRILGTSERSLSRWEAEGVVTPSRRRRGNQGSVYDLEAVVPAVLRHVQDSGSSSDREARARRDRSQAELNELRLKERRAELLSRDQVVRDGVAFVLACKAKLLMIPHMMVQSGLCPVERQDAARDMIHEALEELSRFSTLADCRRVARTGQPPAPAKGRRERNHA